MTGSSLFKHWASYLVMVRFDPTAPWAWSKPVQSSLSRVSWLKSRRLSLNHACNTKCSSHWLRRAWKSRDKALVLERWCSKWHRSSCYQLSTVYDHMCFFLRLAIENTPSIQHLSKRTQAHLFSVGRYTIPIRSPLHLGLDMHEVWGRPPWTAQAAAPTPGTPLPWSCSRLPGPASCARFWREFCLRAAGWSQGNWQQKWSHQSSLRGHRVRELEHTEPQGWVKPPWGGPHKSLTAQAPSPTTQCQHRWPPRWRPWAGASSCQSKAPLRVCLHSHLVFKGKKESLVHPLCPGHLLGEMMCLFKYETYNSVTKDVVFPVRLGALWGQKTMSCSSLARVSNQCLSPRGHQINVCQTNG